MLGFTQAPTRYAVSSSERHTRAPPRSACQPHRQRTLVSTMFAAEEPAAATAAEEPTATADGAAAVGEVAANTGPATTANVEQGAVEQELTYEQLTRKAKLEEIERLRSKEKFITQKTGERAVRRVESWNHVVRVRSEVLCTCTQKSEVI